METWQRERLPAHSASVLILRSSFSCGDQVQYILQKAVCGRSWLGPGIHWSLFSSGSHLWQVWRRLLLSVSLVFITLYVGSVRCDCRKSVPYSFSLLQPIISTFTLYAIIHYRVDLFIVLWIPLWSATHVVVIPVVSMPTLLFLVCQTNTNTQGSEYKWHTHTHTHIYIQKIYISPIFSCVTSDSVLEHK